MNEPRSTPSRWATYAMDGCLIGLFMVSASAFGVLLFHPGSPASRLTSSVVELRALMGVAMGATLVALVHSPFGRRSGAHMNPAVTLTFFRLGRVGGRDAAWLMAFQTVGAVLGVGVARVVFGDRLVAINHVATMPGSAGLAVAFVAEAAISFIQILAVLVVSSSRAERWTGVVAGTLLATWILVEDPLSGVSMNPARSLGSAVWAGEYRGLAIYLVAPPLGMLLAAEVHVRMRRRALQGCAKLVHDLEHHCLYCGHPGRRCSAETSLDQMHPIVRNGESES